MLRRPKQSACAVICAAGLLAASCNRDGQGGPPEIPPASTLVIDFSEFLDGARQGQQDAQIGNWSWAAGNVGFWNVILTATLAVPVAAFAESFNHEPVLMEDGTWTWSYEVVVGGIRYSARLEAVIVRSEVEWAMSVSQDGGYQDFLWFTGVSNLMGTAGSWTLNKDPEDAEEFLFIEWQRDTDDDEPEIKYTNITPQAPENGSYINYGIAEAQPYDAFYDLFGTEDERLIEIEWNRSSNAGRVADEQRFGDGEWHCWNERLVDVECPAGGEM